MGGKEIWRLSPEKGGDGEEEQSTTQEGPAGEMAPVLGRGREWGCKDFQIK